METAKTERLRVIRLLVLLLQHLPIFHLFRSAEKYMYSLYRLHVFSKKPYVLQMLSGYLLDGIEYM
jgi:hypothetical protein